MFRNAHQQEKIRELQGGDLSQVRSAGEQGHEGSWSVGFMIIH